MNVLDNDFEDPVRMYKSLFWDVKEELHQPFEDRFWSRTHHAFGSFDFQFAAFGNEVKEEDSSNRGKYIYTLPGHLSAI
jgi:hypothetical protein